MKHVRVYADADVGLDSGALLHDTIVLHVVRHVKVLVAYPLPGGGSPLPTSNRLPVATRDFLPQYETQAESVPWHGHHVSYARRD